LKISHLRRELKSDFIEVYNKEYIRDGLKRLLNSINWISLQAENFIIVDIEINA